MFMYFLLPHWVPATWRSRAQTSMRAELPSGKLPTTRVRRRISRFSRSMTLLAPSGTRTVRARRPLRRAKRLLRSLFRARESPRGMRRPAGFRGRCPQRIPLWGFAFGLHARRARRVRTAAEATAACGGNREPKQGQRSQRRRPAQGAPDDAGTATRTVPAVRSGGQKGSCGAMRGAACKVWSLRWPASFFRRSLPVRRRSMRGAAPSRRCGRMSAPWRSTFWCWSGQSRAATGSSRRSWGCKGLAICGLFVV